MNDWSWDIIEEFLKKTPSTTKILNIYFTKISLLNIYFSSSLANLNQPFDFFFIKDKNKKLFKALIKKIK